MSSLLDKVRGNLEAAAKNPNTDHHDKPHREPREKKATSVKIATELTEDTRVYVRNCSTQEVMQSLIEAVKLTPETTIKSGRYVQIYQQDIPAFEDWASKGGFFVKESPLDRVLILDLMVDNSNRYHQNRHKKD